MVASARELRVRIVFCRGRIMADRANQSTSVRVCVETGGNVLHEKPATRGEANVPGSHRDQIVFNIGDQAAHFVGKIAIEVDGIGLGDFTPIKLSVAHQPPNHITSQDVVRGEGNTSTYRRRSSFYRRIVIHKMAMVLAVGITHPAYGADADAENVAIGAGRISLEITLQRARHLGCDQVVITARKMIHTDIAITGAGEFLQRQAEQFQALCGIG